MSNINDKIVFVLGVKNIPSFKVVYWKRTAILHQFRTYNGSLEYRDKNVYGIKASFGSAFNTGINANIKKGEYISTYNPWTKEGYIEK